MWTWETLGGKVTCDRVADAILSVPSFWAVKRPIVTALPCGVLRQYCFEKSDNGTVLNEFDEKINTLFIG
jgi:hypothetical protein